MKRTASAASSSSLSSVPESPPKKKQKGKGKDKGVTEGVDAGSEADEEVVTARPAPQAASKVPASKTAQKFVGIVVPRVPSKKKPNKSPSPAPRHSLSPVPPSKHSSPSPKRTTAAHVASDSDDDLADADELLATLINASKPSPKKAKKSVSFHDLPGADASGGSGLDEDRAVRRSVRVVENETRPKASASKGPLGSNFTSASSGAGKFSLKALARAAKKEDRIEKAVEEALQYELPDQVPDDLLRSPSRRDLPTTPPPQSQSQEGYAFINPVATPTASPRKTRVNASDLQALDRMDSLVAPSSSARATADEDDDEPEDEDEVAERRKLAKKTADLVRRDATGGDAAAESEEMQRAARTCWVTDAEATGTLDGRWEEVLEDAEDADEVAKVVVDVLKGTLAVAVMPTWSLMRSCRRRERLDLDSARPPLPLFPLKLPPRPTSNLSPYDPTPTRGPARARLVRCRPTVRIRIGGRRGGEGSGRGRVQRTRWGEEGRGRSGSSARDSQAYRKGSRTCSCLKVRLRSCPRS